MSFAFRIHGLHFYFTSSSSSSSINRAGQRLTNGQQTDSHGHSNDPWNEIDQRNQRVLHPLNAKDTYGAIRRTRTFNYPKTHLSDHSFNLDALQNFSRRRRSSQANDDMSSFDSSSTYQKYLDKRFAGHSTNSDLSFLYGNSVVQSNKGKLLSLFANGDLTIYVNKHGVMISEDGPFWPRDYRILHPTPRLLTRELSPKEFYLTVPTATSSSM